MGVLFGHFFRSSISPAGRSLRRSTIIFGACSHGSAYAKQVGTMCVLSVPLLDQVQARQGGELEADGVN